MSGIPSGFFCYRYSGPFSAAAVFWSGIPFSAVAGTVAGTISVSLVAGILDYFGVSCGWYSGPVTKGILNWTVADMLVVRYSEMFCNLIPRKLVLN